MTQTSPQSVLNQAQQTRTKRVEAYGPGSVVRADIKNADILLFRGDPLASDLIEIGTDSPYSHAAIAFRSSPQDPYKYETNEGVEHVCFIEAVRKGVRMDLLSNELKSYPGAIELWRIDERYLAKFSPAAAIAEARRYLGFPFAYDHLAAFVLDWLTFGLFHLRSRCRNHRAFFCSQLVSRAYVKGGVDLNVRYGDAATAPGDLANGGHIHVVHAFQLAERIPKASSAMR